MSIEILRPGYLSLLAIIPIIVFLHFVMLSKKRSYALKFANFDALARVKGIDLLSKNIIILILTISISVLLIFSLAGIKVKQNIYSASHSYVIAIDSSSSMEALDFSPNRLEAAKQSAINFVNRMPLGTKIGIISFSGNAFIEQDITEDKTANINAIKKIPISSIGGTDIAEAMIVGSNMLEGEEAKALIIISDGRINIGSLDNAISYVNSRSVVIHTIGLGTEQAGQTSFGLSKIDENALKAISYNTEGKYFKVESLENLTQSFSEITELKYKKVTKDYTNHLLTFALILFLIQYILINTRFRILP